MTKFDNAITAVEYQQFYYNWIKNYSKRPDGRHFLESRSRCSQRGILSNADGSALVRLGNTVVLTGVKIEISEVPLQKDLKSFIIPNLHYTSGSTSLSRPGPPSDHVQYLSTVFLRCLESFNIISPDALYSENFCRIFYIDISVLNDEGNIWEAIWISVFEALENTSLSIIDVDYKTGVASIIDHISTRLPISMKLIPFHFITSRYIDGYIRDPTLEESSLSECSNIFILFDPLTSRIAFIYTSCTTGIPSHINLNEIEHLLSK